MPRQKTVYKTGEIAHLWANQVQHYARNQAGNFYFEGSVIYSYGHHHAIAKIFPDKDVVLFNSDTYSSTTAGHHRDVHYALDTDRYRVFDVPNPDADWTRAHVRNAEYLLRLIEEQENLAEAPRKMQVKRLEHRIAALNNTLELQDYCSIFRIKSRMKGEIGKRLRQPREEIESLLENYQEEYEPIYAEHRAKINERTEARREAEREKWARIQKEREEKAKENLDKWHAGRYTGYIGTIDGAYMLRALNDGKIIETSGGARVGQQAAKLVWKLVSKCRNNHEEYKVPPEKVIKVDFYHLTHIGADGNVKIGCHYIKYEEMERLAKQLGWLDAS